MHRAAFERDESQENTGRRSSRAPLCILAQGVCSGCECTPSPRLDKVTSSAHNARLTRRTNMAYGITHFFANGTQAQYEASIRAVHPSRDQLPKGQLFHAAGPAPGGWQI